MASHSVEQTKWYVLFGGGEGARFVVTPFFFFSPIPFMCLTSAAFPCCFAFVWRHGLQRRECCFKLSRKGRTYYFQASDPQELEDWVCMIALAIASSQPSVVEEARSRARSTGASHSPAPPALPPSRRPSKSVGGAAHSSADSVKLQRAARQARREQEILLTAQLAEFYRLHNPDKCKEDHIRGVVESYIDCPDKLWSDLGLKYPGAEVPPRLDVPGTGSG